MIAIATGCIYHYKFTITIAMFLYFQTLRTTMRSIANGDTTYKVPATIEDPAVLEEIKTIIHSFVVQH